MKIVDWNADRIAELTRLWDDDMLSASMIGERMGISRNSVIGKARRLKLRSKALPPVAAWKREQERQEKRERAQAREAAKIKRVAASSRSHEGMRIMSVAAVRDLERNPTKNQLRNVLAEAMANTAILCAQQGASR